MVTSKKGSSASGTSGIIGQQTNGSGEVVVSGSGSLWQQDGKLGVGWRSSGTLTITNRGRVESVGGVIGRVAGTSGIPLPPPPTRSSDQATSGQATPRRS
ncbi:MAG: hypothetical protein KA354_14490 [Phycisphaerae bacterium]|nr:hypothetical protein [Phycisphaerae bacterium]